MSALLDALAGGCRVFDLAQPLQAGIPCSPNHPGFRMALTRRHGDTVRADGGSAASELIVTGGHVGTHIDALAHVSHNGLLHGGFSAQEAQIGGRLRHGGIEELEPIVAPGVLLDVPAARGIEMLSGADAIDVSDLQRAAEFAGVEIRPGDVVLVRTGWAKYFGDPIRFLGHDSGVPGPTESAARWLAEQKILATGSDTTAYEYIPPGAGHRLLPVHRVLLVENAINIMEMLDLEALSTARVYRFCFIVAPLKMVGATGSPIRPLALVDR